MRLVTKLCMRLIIALTINSIHAANKSKKRVPPTNNPYFCTIPIIQKLRTPPDPNQYNTLWEPKRKSNCKPMARQFNHPVEFDLDPPIFTNINQNPDTLRPKTTHPAKKNIPDTST